MFGAFGHVGFIIFSTHITQPNPTYYVYDFIFLYIFSLINFGILIMGFDKFKILEYN